MEHEHAVLLEDELPGGIAAQAGEARRGGDELLPLVEVAGLGLVGGDPGRVLDRREAEHAAPGRELPAERVGRAHHRARRDQAHGPLRDPIVRGDARHEGAVGLPAREEAPQRNRAEDEVADQRDADRDHRHGHRPPQPRRAEHARDDERSDQPCGVVEVDRLLGRRPREQVEREVGHRGDEDERREEEEPGEREPEVQQVLPVRRRRWWRAPTGASRPCAGLRRASRRPRCSASRSSRRRRG